MQSIAIGVIMHAISKDLLLSSLIALVLAGTLTNILAYICEQIDLLQNRISDISVRQREQEKRKMSL